MAGDPSAIMRPSASTNTCSDKLITACMTCSIIRMVMPRAQRPRMTGTKSRISDGFNPAKLLFPIELIARIAQRVVAVAGAGASAGDVGGVGGNLISDDAVFYVFFIRQAEMLFRRDEIGRAHV